MISERMAKKMCRDDLSKIENYAEAVASPELWHCHHRREAVYSRDGLLEIGEYWHRPAAELIFLTESEHHSLHSRGRCLSDETRQKIAEAMAGKPCSDEHRRKIGDANRGRIMSDETKRKMSEAQAGKRLSEEHRLKIGDANRGLVRSDEVRKRLSEAKAGMTWWNDGVRCYMARECPPGCVKGRLKRRKA